MQVAVIIPAAGCGARMQTDTPKQYLNIQNKSVLAHTVSCFVMRQDIDAIIIALHPEDNFIQHAHLPQDARIRFVTGGQTRAHSVMNALETVTSTWVMVHDAARPCLTQGDIDALLAHTKQSQGAILGYPCRDSLKRGYQGFIADTVSRDAIWHALTPQLFRTQDLHQGYTQALYQKRLITDEASAVADLDVKIALVQGRTDNIKVTFPEDLKLAELILKAHEDLE